jgi:hypothetical protein
MFFCCGSRHSGTEWVQRIRGNSQSLPIDDCGDAGGRLAILEGELPGEIRKRARVRTGCPGIAASSTVRSSGGLGRWLSRSGGREVILRITPLTPVLVNVALAFCERCRTSAIISPLQRGEKARRGIHEQCGSDGWFEPHLFFCCCFFAAYCRSYCERCKAALRN